MSEKEYNRTEDAKQKADSMLEGLETGSQKVGSFLAKVGYGQRITLKKDPYFDSYSVDTIDLKDLKALLRLLDLHKIREDLGNDEFSLYLKTLDSEEKL